MSEDQREKCQRIVDAFDEWLAGQVLRQRLQFEELPQLNDMFRVYFANTRSVLNADDAANNQIDPLEWTRRLARMWMKRALENYGQIQALQDQLTSR